MWLNRSKSLACLLIGFAVAAGARQVGSLDVGTREAAAKIIDFILKDGKTPEYDEFLADRIGPRLTGSGSYQQAVRWAMEQFRSLGVNDVHSERFALPAAWEPLTQAKAEMLTPRLQALHLLSLAWSPSTPAQGVRGRIFHIHNLLSAQALQQDRERIRGSIALVDRSSFSFPRGLLPGTYFAALSSLRNYGAQAVLIGGSRSDNDVDYGGAVTMDGSIAALPIARVGREDLALLARLLEQGPVTVEFSYQNRVRSPAEAQNLVAEIRGREIPGEFVILGAHLDSVQVGAGAQDDGTGVAAVLEAARAIQAIGIPPRRSLRLVLFGAEEEWELGSKAYARLHEAELARCSAVLITDTGADTPYGWHVGGREDEAGALAALSPILEPLGGAGISRDPAYLLHSDHTAFLLRGVPSLLLWTEMSRYFQYVHQPGDTYDKVEKDKLAKGAAILAATAYAIADGAKPFAPHLSRPEVEELLKATGQYEGYLDGVTHGGIGSLP